MSRRSGDRVAGRKTHSLERLPPPRSRPPLPHTSPRPLCAAPRPSHLHLHLHPHTHLHTHDLPHPHPHLHFHPAPSPRRARRCGFPPAQPSARSAACASALI